MHEPGGLVEQVSIKFQHYAFMETGHLRQPKKQQRMVNDYPTNRKESGEILRSERMLYTLHKSGWTLGPDGGVKSSLLAFVEPDRTESRVLDLENTVSPGARGCRWRIGRALTCTRTSQHSTLLPLYSVTCWQTPSTASASLG